MLPGVPERRSHDYVRHGTIDLFTALNITRADFVAGMCGKADANRRRP